MSQSPEVVSETRVVIKTEINRTSKVLIFRMISYAKYCEFLKSRTDKCDHEIIMGSHNTLRTLTSDAR